MKREDMKRLIAELAELTTTRPCEGIKVGFNEDNITEEISAEIEGPTGTPYEGGLFRVKLLLGGEYPSVPPKGFFLTKAFHPNISEKGEICVSVLKKDWTPEMGIRHVLLAGAVLSTSAMVGCPCRCIWAPHDSTQVSACAQQALLALRGVLTAAYQRALTLLSVLLQRISLLRDTKTHGLTS